MTELNDIQLFVLEKEQVTCSDVTELLGDYTDGELSPSVHARLESHIEGCEYCQEMARTYALTIELAADLRETPIPFGVQNRLRKALNKKLGLSLPLVSQAAEN